MRKLGWPSSLSTSRSPPGVPKAMSTSSTPLDGDFSGEVDLEFKADMEAIADALYHNQHTIHGREWKPDNWPREPSAYSICTHFHQRKKEREIDGRYIRSCIEDGRLLPDRDKNALFVKEFEGISYYLVVADEDGYTAVTMYPWVSDLEEAYYSSLWTNEEVRQTLEVCLKKLERDGDREYLKQKGLEEELWQAKADLEWKIEHL